MKLIQSKYMLFFIFITAPIFAMDHIKFEKGQSHLDTRSRYKTEVIRQALEHTVENYGDYKITTDAPIMNSLRARKHLETGKLLNVFIAVADPNWESETIAIKIPVRKGLLNYRLLLIHKDDLPLFKNITTTDELKKLTVGLLFGWSITDTMEKQGFAIKKGNNYDGIFKMLDSHRFHYIPRGVNEIFGELEQRKEILKNIVIEPNIVLHIPAPSYIFVSPKYPRIAKRLEEGLELMVKDGSFDALFHQYFDNNIKQADLNKRHIIKIDNPFTLKTAPLDRKELWFTP